MTPVDGKGEPKTKSFSLQEWVLKRAAFDGTARLGRTGPQREDA